MAKKLSKVLEIEDFIFILPEDFHGDIIDALVMIIEYIKMKRDKENKNEILGDNVKHHIQLADDQNSLMKIVETDFEDLLSLKYRFFEYNPKTNTYTPTDTIQ